MEPESSLIQITYKTYIKGLKYSRQSILRTQTASRITFFNQISNDAVPTADGK